MSQSTKDSEKIKKIESGSWKGPVNFEFTPNSLQEFFYYNWNQFLLEKSIEDVDLNGKSVVNVGGGHGNEAEFLIKNGVEKVLLIDIAPGQIESAKIRKKQHNLYNLELEIGDAECLNHENKCFDIGYIYMALHHFPSHKKSISEICRTSNHVIFVDIMAAKITNVLNFFGFYKEEWCGIEPNRLNGDEVKQILCSQSMKMKINYYFLPPYYSDNILYLKLLKIFTRFINSIIWIRPVAVLFGNICIINGNSDFVESG